MPVTGTQQDGGMGARQKTRKRNRNIFGWWKSSINLVKSGSIKTFSVAFNSLNSTIKLD